MSNKDIDIVNPLLAKGSRGLSLVDEVINITGTERMDSTSSDKTVEPKANDQKVNGWNVFRDGLEKYTGVSGQGAAIWVPTEVKKRIEAIRAKASNNIPIRSMAAAMIMAFIEEHKKELSRL